MCHSYTSHPFERVSVVVCPGVRRVAVALGVAMLALARFVEDDPWWGQDSLMT